ncbi:hypothetical protein [Methylobacterium nodulans]|uniref:Uncharacterized protein n=1 Tax=Methylobacterium nodulans (strain LMG 21967 / CNCM I-2342 / ORS 2060) TaxID=460265 RepID=B8IA02_METNO|nr:hypothetical protein [Methylobacterium nodulans]ACL57230.1 conserved hypothetical protein [Methylobacterium nodulans ORS 2060]ACL58139.1 conserved hypothetical protein [Methylobacterium nodulans ORS 2060]
MTEDRTIEYSPLSGPVTQAGITVDVKIFRFLGTGDPWTLEVVDHEGGSTVWDETFLTEHAAYEAFRNALAQEGIGSFVMPPETRH